MMQTLKYKLYFSYYCEHSIKFLKFLKFYNIILKIKKICIDSNNNIPLYIKRVPTLVIKFSKKKNILIGKEAFMWMKEYINAINRKKNINHNNQNINYNNQNINHNNQSFI